mmetsp:Transcript_131870/g.381400  ORF Transcript_131870/g.381400 Transcript_131870/m.381400 type:complete len:218 (+) Transcript_131870:115-768(+)
MQASELGRPDHGLAGAPYRLRPRVPADLVSLAPKPMAKGPEPLALLETGALEALHVLVPTDELDRIDRKVDGIPHDVGQHRLRYTSSSGFRVNPQAMNRHHNRLVGLLRHEIATEAAYAHDPEQLADNPAAGCGLQSLRVRGRPNPVLDLPAAFCLSRWDVEKLDLQRPALQQRVSARRWCATAQGRALVPCPGFTLEKSATTMNCTSRHASEHGNR